MPGKEGTTGGDSPVENGTNPGDRGTEAGPPEK